MPNVGTNYRIPVVISRDGVVNILAENRGGSGSDSGRHKLALVRSTDSGQSFTSVDNIYNDSLAGPADGLNLGAAVYDSKVRGP